MPTTRPLAAGLLGALALAAVLAAPTRAPHRRRIPITVVARVNGVDIRQSDLA